MSLFDDVVHYFEMGIHRTGSAVDYQASDWIESRLASVGLDTRRQTWSVRQYFLEDVAVRCGTQDLEAFPIWYSPATGPDGLTAGLSLIDDPDCPGCSGDTIGLVTSPRDAGWWQVFRGSLAEGKLRAVLAVYPDLTPWGMIQAQNVDPSNVGRDLPVPVLQIRASDLAVYQAAIQSASAVTIQLQASVREDTPAHNVMAVKPGGPEWIVISTPSSGWFTCAGERGPGIAIFLALAEWASRRRTRYSYLFTANSGHELGFWGARQLHEGGHLPSPTETRAWLHLGASIATPVWRDREGEFQPDQELSHCLLQTTDDSFTGILQSAFQQVDGVDPVTRESLAGELANVRDHGYKGFGLVGGGNIHFHTREDTPRTVSEVSLIKVQRALEQTFSEIEDGD
jgi:hypothetical protein